MRTETEVLVIGGGVVGICSAYYLTRMGRKVTLLERGEVCSGSSYGNAGLIVPSHSIPLPAPGVLSKGIRWMFNPESPLYIKPRLDPAMLAWMWKFRKFCKERPMREAMAVIRDLSLASLALYEELAHVPGLEFGFAKQGLLMAFKSQPGLEAGIHEARMMQEAGIEAQVLSPSEIREREPNVRVDAAGGVYYPQDAHLTPDRFVRGLARRVEEEGGEIRTSTEVLGVEALRGRITSVKSTRGDFHAEAVLLAAGSWSPAIARDLRVKLPIQPAKGYSITFRPPPMPPRVPIMLAEAKVIMTPMIDSLRFAGTLEFAGFDLSINRRRVDAILKAVPTYLPDLAPDRLELLEIWRGLRPCTPDGLPFLGRHPSLENLAVAAGHAMIGISLGPISGKLAAQVVARQKPDIDLTPLRLDRFG